MYPHRKVLAAMLPLIYSPYLLAADQLALLDNVVVTATRTARTTDEALQSVTVITREDIEKSGARDLMGLLDAQPGLNVARTGGPGKGVGVYVRGTNSDHVLVLVDGVRAAAASVGTYDWNALSPEQIERIEIVRGPRASLYGSDAVGGVIQIFTRRTQGVEAGMRVGSWGTVGTHASIGGGDTWRYSLSVGQERTDGIPVFTTGNKAYGFDRKFVNAALDSQLTETLGVAFRLNQAWGKNELDPDTGDGDFQNRTASLKFSHQVNSAWRQTLILGNQLDQYQSHSPYTPSTIETNRQSLAWQHDLAIAGGLMSIGVDHWNDQVSKDRSGSIDQGIDNTGAFIQHQFDALGSDWVLGARHDQHGVFGGHNTWNAGWGHELGRGFRLTASYGTAFKAPTIGDLFWPYNESIAEYGYGGTYFKELYIFQGNPQLQPEKSRSAEVGLRYRGSGLNLAANLYETRLRNLIDWTHEYTPTGGSGSQADPYAGTYTYYPGNVSSARIRGLELMGDTTIGAWNLRAAYTRLLTENLETGKQLDRRPGNTFLVKSWRSFGPHRINFSAEGYSDRLDADGKRKLQGYWVFNAGYDYAYSKELRFGFRVENAFDREYRLARSSSRVYDAPGLGVFATVNYAFK